MTLLETLRIGSGFDVHAFSEEAKPLILGGVEIDPKGGLDGHSDADALTHAIVDAILGALGEGDLGTHFPSSDPQWKGARSLGFFKKTTELLQKHRRQILSIDATVIAQKPRLAPHIQKMRSSLAEAMQLPLERLSVKSTTTDHLGFTGREEGIAVHAVCLLSGVDDK